MFPTAPCRRVACVNCVNGELRCAGSRWRAFPLGEASDDGENHVSAQITGIRREDESGTDNKCDCFKRDHIQIPSVLGGG